MKLLVIRHGDPDYSIDSLTEKGWREARLLAERLKQLDVRDFYVSPLGRARATSRPTLEALHREAEVLDWLHEFRGVVVDPCTAETRICWNFAPQYIARCPEMNTPDWLSSPLFQTGNVRKIYEETTRGVDALLAKYGYHPHTGLIYACEHNTRDTVVLFCHCAVGQAIIAHLTGVPLPLLWHSFFLPTSSVTELRTEERIPGEVVFRCVQMGDTSHLLASGEPVSNSGLYPETAR